MVTARARVPAMACVGGPAAGRGARRRRDSLRSSASRGTVTSKPLRPVERNLECRVRRATRSLLSKFGTTDWPTDGHTDKWKIGLHRKILSFRARANFTLAVNL